MRIVTFLFKTLHLRLIYSAATAGLVIILYCSPLLGYSSKVQHESTPFLVPNRIENSFWKCEYLSKRNKKWQDLSPEEKEKARRKYKEWQSLSPEEKATMRQRMNRLKRMSPKERKSYKQLHKKWRHLPPKERKQLQNELDNWENLSPQQQEAIRHRFMK